VGSEHCPLAIAAKHIQDPLTLGREKEVNVVVVHDHGWSESAPSPEGARFRVIPWAALRVLSDIVRSKRLSSPTETSSFPKTYSILKRAARAYPTHRPRLASATRTGGCRVRQKEVVLTAER